MIENGLQMLDTLEPLFLQQKCCTILESWDKMLLDSIKKWAKKVSKNSQELFKKKIQKHRKFVKIIVTMKHELYQILGPLRSICKAPCKYKWRVWHLCHTPSKMGLRKFSRKELHFLLLQPTSLLKCKQIILAL